MDYVSIPIDMLAIGKPLPVDIWNPSGQLLLRRGQLVVSEQHREKLHAFQASTTATDAQAWQRSYERMVHAMLRDGVDLKTIAQAPMPSNILQRDYIVSEHINGGWLDLQEVLRGILYQGGLAINPLQRLTNIETKVLKLLQEDPDDSLFLLFQALPDLNLGYCATHALLCAAICELTAQKLALDSTQRQSLLRAALTMNIGMARDQDSFARQKTAPSDAQRERIRQHPQRSVDILQSFDVGDFDQIDIVQWHHEPDSPLGFPGNLMSRRLLSLADTFVAKMATRETRAPISPVQAVKSMIVGATGNTVELGSAMAQAVGFYPPGSYVQLVTGEIAVSARRGTRANTPWVIGILDKKGMPVSRYTPYNTAEPAYAIHKPVSYQHVRVIVNAEKVRRALNRLPGF
ncbi:MAG: hypothetical protein IPH35_05770 [Rhodoferax sp.]|nr:hypothetical protein [Rhodoferax sp.]